MRLIIDLDGTICSLRRDNETYEDVRVLPGVKEKLEYLKNQGWYIIIQTARHMKTCEGNVGKVKRHVGKVTLDWLEKHQIPYDEIYFGKPYGDVYLDDLAINFKTPDILDKLAQVSKQKLNVVITMAGNGSRFSQANYTIPKPYISVFGEPMFAWALKGFKAIEKCFDVSYYFIILKDHEKEYRKLIDQHCNEKFHVIVLDKVTGGQAETCLEAKEHIDNHNKLIIFNSDTFFQSNHLLQELQLGKSHGLIPCFQSKDARYSFAQTDEWAHVIRVEEKEPISTNATIGLYYFLKGEDFIFHCREMIDKNERVNGEFYIAPIYNRMVENGKIVKITTVDTHHILGTPEELKVFLETYDNKTQNFRDEFLS